ncbi:hypothetical protein, partial [Pseudobutyrivibrio sp.]|uniref:hypothetical protein n=1 Tax=Pseudobutyrivibrio sp. TaxID=2014367 RepID=UPI00386D7BB2
MELEAIKDDGIYSTFKFNTQLLPTISLTKANLHYCKLDCDDKWLPAQRKILYKNCPELGDARFPNICAETMKSVTDRIKIDMVKKDNAIWSTIKFVPWTDHFTVNYDKAYVDKPITAQEMEIENTKKTLQRLERLRENSYYGLYPRHAGLTCHFDEKLKEDIKASLEGKWKPKAIPWCGYSPANVMNNEAVEYINRYSKSKEEKEKKDMNVTLMIVPEGMNSDFVNKVKANFQSNNSIRLFVASTDIGFSCPYGTTRTKYDLFEDWVKRGKVDIVYFMLGFEKDPDVRAFESFVRGITEAEVPGKVDVRVVYQKDDILNDVNNLRNAYFDEADAKEDLENAGNNVVRKAQVMKEVYNLDNAGLDIIKYSKGKIDASDELVINDIMDTAFASDDNTKPAKKGGKKND